MYVSQERTRENVSHDYDRIDDSYDGPSHSSTTYRSAMSPRVINVQRSRNSGLGSSGGGVMTRVYQSHQTTGGSGGQFGPGLASLANFPGVPIRGGNNTSTALVGMNQVRHREKRQLEQLNDKFAQYVEKVRFLEAQNRKLLMEIEALKSRSGQGSSRIKDMYEIEMSEAQKLIDSARRDAAAATVKAEKAEQDTRKPAARLAELNNLKDAENQGIDALRKKLAENEAQIALFRRRIDDLDEEGRRYKAQIQRITSEIARLQNEIQTETFTKSSGQVEKMALEDEIASLRQMHEADLAELRAKTVSSDLDPSQFFRNELSQAIREIRSDYENRIDSKRGEAQNQYATMYNELIIRQQRNNANPVQNESERRQEERFRTEIMQSQNQAGYLRAQNENIKNRISDIQRKLNALREDGGLAQAKLAKDIDEAKQRLETANRNFAEVTNMKTSLEKEIGTYRDLLEGQTGLRGYVDRIVQATQQQAIDQPVVNRADPRLTSITRTMINTTGPGYGFGGNFSTTGGLSALVNQTSRQNNTYQTLSSGLGSTSFASDIITRRSEDF